MIRKDDTLPEILDRRLQQMQEGSAAPADGLSGAQSDIRPLLDTAGRVLTLLSTQGPPPEFIAASEIRLLRRIRKSAAGPVTRESRKAVPASRGWLRSAAMVAAAAFTVVCASGLGVSAASAQTLPGDALYPVKQGLEEISLAFSASAAGDVILLADFADERLDEIEELAAKDRETDLIAGLDFYDKTLSRLDAAMDQLPPDSESAQLEDIQARLARHTTILLALQDQLPEQAQSGLTRAIEHSRSTKDRTQNLRENRGPEAAPPGQDMQSTKEAGEGNGGPASARKTPDTDPKDPKNTRTPKFTKTPKPTKTLK